MSKVEFTSICCTVCGRLLYQPFSNKDTENVKHIDYYILNTVSGEEQICPKCYEANMAKHFELKNIPVEN